MNKLSPLIKGIITGVVIVALQLLMYYKNVPGNSYLIYVVYAIYAAGIFWTLWDYSRTPAYQGKFGELFNQGFRCFIMVILILVIYVYAFGKAHPELAEQAAENYRTELMKDIHKTPSDRDALVEKARKNYVAGTIQVTIFATLILGAFFTAASGLAIIQLRRNK